MCSVTVLITSPSLNPYENVSGISAITSLILRHNKVHRYVHFELGKKDAERGKAVWIIRLVRTYLQWIHVLAFSKAQVIHFNLALEKRSLLRDTPLIGVARLFGKRIIVHFHGGELLNCIHPPLWSTWLLRLTLWGDVSAIVLSDREKSVLRARVGNVRLAVLPHCVDDGPVSEFRRSYACDTPISALFLGRIAEEKGLSTLLHAFRCLRRAGVVVSLSLAGAGPEEQKYVGAFRELLGARFEFKGIVAGEEKIELLKASNMFLLPSAYEGLPMALLESMAFGLVPIATDVGSIRTVVVNGRTGLLVSKDSPEDLAKAIEKVSSDRSYMAQLGKNARAYICQNHSIRRYMNELNRIYRAHE